MKYIIPVIAGCWIAWLVATHIAIREERILALETELEVCKKFYTFIEFRDNERAARCLRYMIKRDTPSKLSTEL